MLPARLAHAALALTPTGMAVLIALCGLALWVLWRARLLDVALIACLTAAILAWNALPVGVWLFEGLRSRFPPFVPDDRPVAGIIVLGSFSWAGAPPGPFYPPPGGPEDRRLDALALARRYPTARIVAASGPVDPRTQIADADLIGRYFIAQGVRPERMILERRSTNTFENARFSYPLARPKAGERWLLVTSSWHMPRAMGAFRKAGFPVVAAPAAIRPSESPQTDRQHADLAWKELAGLVIYNALGRTSAVFPAP